MVPAFLGASRNERSRAQGLASPISRILTGTPPLYLVTAAILAGDGAGNLHVSIPLWIVFALAAMAVALYLLSRPALGTITALLALWGAATIAPSMLLRPPPSLSSLTRFSDNSIVTIEGTLVRAPEYEGGERTYLYMDADKAASVPGKTAPAAGILRITVLDARGLSIGDRVRATGKIRFPRNDGDPAEFDYRAWLMRQGIAATMFVGKPKVGVPKALEILGHRNVFPASAIEHIRERISAFIGANLAYPEDAEMRALIIGERGGIGEQLRNEFALTGMAHLLVISGLHLGFVAAAAFMTIRFLAGFFPKLMIRGLANKFAAVGAALASCAYASIAGHHVSTIRALVMVLAYALAIVIDRSRELMASLALAALVICVALPGSTADIGFQLSFASVAAILLGMRRFSAWWRWRYANPLAPPGERSRWNHVAEWTAGYVAVSFWALLGTAPLTAFHFNQFSLVGLVANAVVVPIMGFGSVVCGLCAAAASFVYLPISREILRVAGICAAAGTWLAGWFMRWPFAWERLFTPTVPEIVIAYGLLALWLTAPLAGELMMSMRRSLGGENRTGVSGRAALRRSLLVLLLAGLAGDAGWWTYQRYFNRDLRITFLSVGEGDGAVVRFPGSRVMVIDGGGGFRGVFDPGERIVAPYLWANKIMHVDYLTVSHPDRDHFGGLIYIAQNFSPSEFWTGGTSSDDEAYVQLMDAVRKSGARQRICDAFSAPMVISGVTVRCIGPIDENSEVKQNNASMVIRLAYDHSSVLFTGDIEAKAERELRASGANLHSTVLKVPHHGSNTSSTAGFIEAVRPRLAVISLGYDNRFHFPAPDVLQRYHDEAVPVLRTDEDGAIEVEIGPGGASVRSFTSGTLKLIR